MHEPIRAGAAGMRRLLAGLIAGPLAMAFALPAWPQTAKSTAEGIAEYRKLLEDGNPADLFEAKGEQLWKTRRGPKNASLEACDLGKGPGVVKGAFVELPRWFADAGKVMDLEARLVWCIGRCWPVSGPKVENEANTPVQTVHADFPHTAYQWPVGSQHYAGSRCQELCLPG